MKIKLQDYCLVSNEFIKALNDYGIPKHFIQTIPAEKLVDNVYDELIGCSGNILSEKVLYDQRKQDYLNSEIEIQ